jgi:hypothetical protein
LDIYKDNSGKWSNKDKLNALKLVKEAIRTKLEILLQGPTNFYVQQLQNIVNELAQKIESRNSPYFETDLLLHD